MNRFKSLMKCFIESFVKDYVNVVFLHFMVGKQVTLSTKSTHVYREESGVHTTRGQGSKI